MQPKLRSHGAELLLGGLYEPYPCQPMSFAAGLVGFLEGGGFRCPATVYVDGVVHDHITYDNSIPRHAPGVKKPRARRLPPRHTESCGEAARSNSPLTISSSESNNGACSHGKEVRAARREEEEEERLYEEAVGDATREVSSEEVPTEMPDGEANR
jgi:hypothetical protein